MTPWEWFWTGVLNLGCGAVSGWLVSEYFRRADRKRSTYMALHNLQSYLGLLNITVNDYIESGDTKQLYEFLKEEPYAVFVELDINKVKGKAAEARTKAVQVIQQLKGDLEAGTLTSENAGLYNARAFQARIAILAATKQYL